MLVSNPHSGLKAPGNHVSVVKGDYYYYHYGCDGQDDRGWGCGYRTLQSLCSWSKENLDSPTRDVPSIPEIQKALVDMEDKEERFRGSRDWIGSVEVGLCLDYFYNVPCKIEHITRGANLNAHLQVIEKHFIEFGSPVMMGGDSDSSSKGVCGVCSDVPSLLVVIFYLLRNILKWDAATIALSHLDPHFYSKSSEVVSRDDLQTKGWISWKLIEDFDQQSFYNICLPQLKTKRTTRDS